MTRPIIKLPCTAQELESALHKVCDHDGLWDANIRVVWLDPSIDPADRGEIPRVTNRRDNRPARIKALGNGQFPLSAAGAFHWGFALLLSFERSAK